jgi:8-oxo-dGTP pyrophosphatase MutT (NUDIX family)
MAVPEQPVKAPGTPAVRPKDAATLIIYRQRRGAVEVLMGQRHHKHRFLPQSYVFPGGRVDPHDSRVRSATPMRDDVATLLTRRATPARARGLIAAAIRETFEEAGLVIGKPDPAPHRPIPANWQPFFETGMAPCFENLNYVARAVTPPWRPIRFNARFFMVDEKHVSGDLAGSGELLDLTYLPIARTAELDLPLITTRVLALVDDLARRPPVPDKARRIAFFRHNGVAHDVFLE